MRRRQSTLPSDTSIGSARRNEFRDGERTLARADAALSWAALLISMVSMILLWASAHRRGGSGSRNRPRLHIFTAPKPFVGIDALHQTRALQSWLSLKPRPHITLLGSGLETIAQRYGVSTANVDATFLGVPFFSAVIHAANNTDTTPTDAIVVVLNADVVLFHDFANALTKLSDKFGQSSWLAIGGRWDVNTLPRQPRFWNPRSAATMAMHVRRTGTLHTYGGVDVWAWASGRLPTVEGGIPPFILGRGRYDNWFTDAILKSQNGSTQVVDISEAVTIAHVRHDHHLVTTTAAADTDSHEVEAPYWIADPAARFELYINAHLAATYGSFIAQHGTVLHAPYKLAACVQGACLLRRRRPHTCRCEHAPFVNNAMSDPFVVTGSRVIMCGLLSNDIVDGKSKKDIAKRWAIYARHERRKKVAFGLPLTLHDVLTVVKQRISIAAVVLMVAASGEEELLANSICSARVHGVFDRVVVAALDEEMYRYGMLLGWPVFFADVPTASTTGKGVRARRRLHVTNTLLSKGLSVVSVAPGVMLRTNITRHLGRTLEQGTDMALVPREDGGRTASTEFMFIRGSTRSARVIEKSLANIEVHPMQAMVEIACGRNGVVSVTPGKLCRNEQIRVQFLSDSDVAFVGSGKQHSDNTALLVPDDRENSMMRLEILHVSKLAMFDSFAKLCVVR